MHARTRPGPGWAALLAVCAGCASGIVPATVPMDRSFRVDATIDSQPVRVMLDTGCTRSSVKREVADRLGLQLRPEPRATVTDATGVERPIDGMVLLPSLCIGETTWAAFEACCYTLHTLTCEGLIGMEVLGSGVGPEFTRYLAPVTSAGRDH